MGMGKGEAFLRYDQTGGPLVFARDLAKRQANQDQVPPAEEVDDGDDDKNKVVERDTSTLDRLKELIVIISVESDLDVQQFPTSA